MNIQRRILQSLRPRKDGILLRSDVCYFGSPSQVSVALNSLVSKGLLAKLHRGIYAKTDQVELEGANALLERALIKVANKRKAANQQTQIDKRKRLMRINSTATYVRRLAMKEGIVFTPTFADQWAKAVTTLAGDEVNSDKIDDLLVALTRAGKLSPRDMSKLVIAHHRSLIHV
jgi:hypothetical protein